MNSLKIRNNSVTLVDQVEDKLLDYIEKEDLKPGDPIPNEKNLSEALGVGRSVLREALSRIRMMGLVETRTKRGMILSEPSLFRGLKKVVNPKILSEKSIFNLLNFRIILEIGLCDLIFDNVSEQDIEDLEEIVKRGEASKYGEYSPLSEYEFHSKLYQISGNNMIIEFQDIIHPISDFMKNKFNDYILPENIKLEEAHTRIDHNEIVNSLKSGDREKFRQAIIHHFDPYKFINRKLSSD